MTEITLVGCPPDVLLSHLALYGLAAILDAEGITGVRAAWSRDGDQRPVVSVPGLTAEQAAAVITGHARRGRRRRVLAAPVARNGNIHNSICPGVRDAG